MGWNMTYKPENVTATDFLIRDSLSFTWSSTTDAAYKVIASAIVKGKTFYAAVERLDLLTGERIVWAAVTLMEFHPKERHNFGWKDLDETMGPYECECPARILDLLTPTLNTEAIAWRAACRARLSKPKPFVGCTITLYGKDYKVDENLGRKGWGVTSQDGRFYRMTAAQVADATVVVIAVPVPAPVQVVIEVKVIRVYVQSDMFAATQMGLI